MILEADVRAWSDRNRTHKAGWLREGDIILIDNEYKNWRKFSPVSDCSDLLPLTSTYPDYYFNWLDYEAALPSPEPTPEPDPTPIDDDDAALGRSIRILLTELAFLYKYFKEL